jgi:hypothetical protein
MSDAVADTTGVPEVGAADTVKQETMKQETMKQETGTAGSAAGPDAAQIEHLLSPQRLFVEYGGGAFALDQEPVWGDVSEVDVEGGRGEDLAGDL